MAYVTGICPNCGATQNVDTSLQAAACTCCFRAYLVKDAMVSVGGLDNCIQKARSLIRLNQSNRAQAYIIEGLTIDSRNEELQFYYKMTNTNAGGLNAAEYSRRHPYIEPYEEIYVSANFENAKYYFGRFWGNFDQKRCELAIRYMGGLPNGFSGGQRSLYGFAIANFYNYLPLNQIEFLLSHDTRREVRPYEKVSFSAKETYGFFGNKVRWIRVEVSMYDILTGKVVLPQPNHSYDEPLPTWLRCGANSAVAALVRRYYPG